MSLDSEDGSDLNASRSPPRRRRSTFFEKRVSLVPQAEPEKAEVAQARNDCKDTKKKYLQDMQRYYENLSKEKEAWKFEARQRRFQYFDIKSQLKAAAAGSLSSSINYSVLSNDDIDFLKGKPNIVKIADSVQDLKKQVTITMHIMKRLKSLNERVMSDCEHNENEAEQYVFEHSVLDLTE